MKTRSAWIVAGTGVGTFVVHAGLLLFAFLIGMSGVAAHGPAASAADFGPRVGSVLVGILGFPFLDLALCWRGSALTGWMWVVAGVLTSATWAGVASWWIARRRRLRK
ncbi:MAG: hypothetical protein JNL28_01310 [Planctomycetes bacterium]|nr:hypothetical protein [Planctomycetota bacterium]